MKEDIIEGNKIIAEFDGFVYYPEDTLNGIKGVLRKDDRASMHLDFDKPFHPKYHTSWNELMPVVQKIKKWSVPDNLWEDFTLYHAKIKTGLMNADINAVWLAVVEFIKWYNSQPNSV